jgi:hypothetical protein
MGFLLTALAFGLACALGWPGPTTAQTSSGKTTPPAPTDPWPRQMTLDGGATALVYQPQVDSWQGNVLEFRAAVAIRPAGSTQEVFGVVWATARTRVDRVARMVTLADLAIARSDFPTLADRGAAYAQALKKRLPPAGTTIALDRIEASLAASTAVKPAGVEVKNDPPRVIVSESPAILVPIDGQPVLQPVAGMPFERVINTRALVLRDLGGPTYYLHVYDGWLYAGAATGPWYQLMVVPPAMNRIAQNLARTGVVDLLDGEGATPRPSLARGVPAIYVSETPAELIVFAGPPRFTAIAGTQLQWAANTAADVIHDTAGGAYYALLSGRWYRAPSLTAAGWTYVASAGLPADFRRIPVSSPAGVVLASVAGTPQAREAVIANSIPQTATIPRVNGPTFVPSFDGPPELRPIPGTQLYYVVNSAVPIINVSVNSYYALRAGVWFSATSLGGPWYVAAWVPEVVYTIPVTSSLHYVTYVHVYGSTPQVVYVGYTPGYLGTVVTPEGVVVYGTGYLYPTWVGTVWYPPPATYGMMAQPVYNPAAGMAFGFAMGVTTAALVSTAYYHPAYYGYPCCGTTTGNVYGHYSNVSWSGTRTYSSYSDGTLNERGGGSYTNYRTGTTGTYGYSRSYNTETGNASRNETRTFNTPYGSSGDVSRTQSYDASTGRYTYDKTGVASGPGGTQVNTQRQAVDAPGQAGVERQTTVTNPNTGASATTDVARGADSQGAGAARQTTYTNPSTGQTQTHISAAGRQGGDVYADHDGNVYKNTGSGWQKQTSGGGWQSASGDTSWADREQQARSQGEDRFSSFRQSGGWGSSGGGWGDRFGGEGGWGGRFGGGRFGGFRR